MTHNEKISVVPRKELIQAGLMPDILGERQGHFVPFTPDMPFEEFEQFVFGNRKERTRHGVRGVEWRPWVQQLATHAVIMRGDEILTLSNSHGDRRVKHKTSVGVGGHLDQSDASFLACLQREFDEEFTFSNHGRELDLSQGWGMEEFFTVTPLGIISDQRDQVGRAHLPVVFLLQMKNPDTQIVPKPHSEHEVTATFRKAEDILAEEEAGELVLAGWANILLRPDVLPLVTAR